MMTYACTFSLAFLANGFPASEPVRGLLLVFSSCPLLRDRQCRHAALCRPIETSSDVGMIGMITASARHHRPCRQRNGTKPKFFNDFSRACMRVRTRRRPIGVSNIRIRS
jgi:hypothetical protein